MLFDFRVDANSVAPYFFKMSLNFLKLIELKAKIPTLFVLAQCRKVQCTTGVAFVFKPTLKFGISHNYWNNLKFSCTMFELYALYNLWFSHLVFFVGIHTEFLFYLNLEENKTHILLWNSETHSSQDLIVFIFLILIT